jgi:hypothetical protein
MNRTVPFLSHCLAHGPAVTAEILRRTLPHDKRLGFAGQVIVAATVQDEARNIVEAFAAHEMAALVCGFLPGDKPDPWENPDGALEALKPQIALAGELAAEGVGPKMIVGPTHTLHRKARPNGNDEHGIARWLEKLSGAALVADLSVCLEPLNPVEDGTGNPFHTLFRLIQPHGNLFLQWDTGHAHAHGLDAGNMLQMSNWIGYLEFANVGRHPLHTNQGIDFAAYARAVPQLANCQLFGDEPFDRTVINAFGLQDLCDTTTPGPRTLELDADFLRNTLRVMA